MQPMRKLSGWLSENVTSQNYIFKLQDIRALFPELSNNAFKTLLSRAANAGYLSRACRGLYISNKVSANGLELFHIAAMLRSNEFNYISLETALSDVGIISQVPVNWITLMSSGRSNIISCGKLGHIEFIHTQKTSSQLVDEISYDQERRLWRASVQLALKDMRATNRNCDLIDWDIVDEYI